MSHDVFISYSSHDKLVAEAVVEQLSEHGLRCWRDDSELLVGDHLHPTIVAAIHRSAVVVWLASPSSCDSDWVAAELTEALRRRIRVIPVLLSPLEQIVLRPPLRDLMPLGGLKCHFYTSDQGGKSLARACNRYVSLRLRKRLAAISMIVLMPVIAAVLFSRLSWRLPALGVAQSRVSESSGTNPAVDFFPGLKHPLLKLISQEAPPATPAQSTRPRLACDILWRHPGDKEFRVLNDGEVMTSQVDEYFFLIQTSTAGYLYVFQIDSCGNLNWTFPQNPGDEVSTGRNPVEPGQVIQIPGNDDSQVFFLDDHPGIENLIFVFSAVRWNVLEQQLIALQRKDRPLPAPESTPWQITERGVGGRRKLAKLPVVTKQLEDGIHQLQIAGPELESSGDFLIVRRWFRHE